MAKDQFTKQWIIDNSLEIVSDYDPGVLTLWLADQIFSLVEDKKELATNALSIVLKNLKNETSHE